MNNSDTITYIIIGTSSCTRTSARPASTAWRRGGGPAPPSLLLPPSPPPPPPPLLFFSEADSDGGHSCSDSYSKSWRQCIEALYLLLPPPSSPAPPPSLFPCSSSSSSSFLHSSSWTGRGRRTPRPPGSRRVASCAEYMWQYVYVTCQSICNNVLVIHIILSSDVLRTSHVQTVQNVLPCRGAPWRGGDGHSIGDGSGMLSKCISKGIWRQGVGFVVRSSYVSTLINYALSSYMPLLVHFWVTLLRRQILGMALLPRRCYAHRCTYTYVYTCIFVMCIYIYIYIHMYTYIYIYVYRERER